MRSSRHLTLADRLCKYSTDMLEIENFNVYTKCLRSGIKKKYLGMVFFCLNHRTKIEMRNIGSFVPIILGTDTDKQPHI